MQTRILKNLVTWIKKQIYVSRKQGACVKVVLHHVGTSGRLGPEIATVNVGESKQPGEAISDDDIEIYAGELESEAVSYAEGIGQTQTFAVAAHFEEDETRALARQTFTIRVEAEEEDNADISTEPANAAGSLKQQMRHNEALMRMTVASFGSVLNTLQQQNKQLSEMVGKMLDDRVEQMESVEALVSAKHERQIEVEREAVSAKQKAQVLDNVLALLPAVANKALGRKIVPETTDVIQLQVLRFIEALTPSEIERIMTSVESPEKRIALVQLIELVQQKVGAANGAEEKQPQ